MSSALPTVSIVTPSYNQGQFVEATIQSVLAQDYQGKIEYLVVDGRSTDSTLEVLEKYEGRIRFISEKDQGQSDAINKGFQQTVGDIVAWVNSDDTLAPDAVSSAVAALQKAPDAAMVYGDADFIDGNGDFIRPCAHIERYNRYRLLHYSDFIVQPAAFIRRAAFEAVGGLDPSLHYAMDYDLWLKLSHRFPIAYLPKLMAHYRWLGDNKSARGGWERLREVGLVAQHHGAKRLPAFFRLEQINLLNQEAFSAMRYGDPSRALMLWAKAIGALASSPRAIKSILSPFTWRIIHTGRVLRRVSFRPHVAPSLHPVCAVAGSHPAAEADWMNVTSRQAPIAALEKLPEMLIAPKAKPLPAPAPASSSSESAASSAPLTPWDQISEELSPSAPAPVETPAAASVTIDGSSNSESVISRSDAPAPTITIDPPTDESPASGAAETPASVEADTAAAANVSIPKTNPLDGPRITMEFSAGPVLTSDPDSGFSSSAKAARKRNPFFVEVEPAQSGNGNVNGNGQH